MRTQNSPVKYGWYLDAAAQLDHTMQQAWETWESLGAYASILSSFARSAHRPDGQKKAYVRLTADADALDVANKIGII